MVSDGWDPSTPAGLLRRLAAIVYDAVLLAGLLLVASAVVTLPIGLSVGPERAQPLFASPWFRWPHFVYCVAVVAAFHLWFWTHGGQTLGMRAWRLRVVRQDGGPLGPRDAIARWLASLLSWLPFGLGFLWSLVDPCGQAWHDRLSGTRLLVVPKAHGVPGTALSGSGAAAASPPTERPPPEARPRPRD